MQKYIQKIGLGLFFLCATSAVAQVSLPEKKVPVVIVSSLSENVGYRSQMLCLNIASTTNFEIENTQNWIKVIKKGGLVYLQIEQNNDSEERTAEITISDLNKKSVRKVSIIQERNGSSEFIGDLKLTVSSATADRFQPGSGEIANSYDNDMSTLYHSPWGQNVSETNPVTLEYFFSNADRMDYLVYYPRTSGVNGLFGKLSIYYKTRTQTTYQKIGDFDFEKSSSPSIVDLHDYGLPNGLENPTAIKFVVTSGATNESNTGYASCAEMQFFKNQSNESAFEIFADDIFSSLKPSVNQDVIDTLTNPFVKTLAQALYDKTYAKDYRVCQFDCTLNPDTLGKRLHIGSGYTYFQNPTGILFGKGRHVVMVSGIPKGVHVTLDIVKWYDPKNQGQSCEKYPLKNGLNVITKTTDWEGLSYVEYFSGEPENLSTIKLHFVNGRVNGFFDLSKNTNAEWNNLLDNAKYPIVDMVGRHAQCVFPVAYLNKYARSQGRWLTSVYDSIVFWEQRLIGLEKYDIVPKNRVMARVNYNYYMFRDGWGVAFMDDDKSGNLGGTMARVTDPSKLTSSDWDACWGMSHEWGHVHQMQPFFSWGGLGETSNNMNSVYNLQHMGFKTRIEEINRDFMEGTNTIFWNGTWTNGKVIAGNPSTTRKKAYDNRNISILPALCEQMKDSIITDASIDPDKAISYLEIGVFERLALFWRVHCYMTQVKGMKDFTPDLYEHLRESYDASTVYGKYKYAVEARTQLNDSRNKNVVPFQLNFIEQASRIAGYNLYPYFEKYGFFRTIALYYDDYGNYFYLMTKEMKTQFKDYMDSLVQDGTLKEMPSGMLEEMRDTKTTLMSGPDWSSLKK